MSNYKIHQAGRDAWATMKAVQPNAAVTESDYEFAFCSGYDFAIRETVEVIAEQSTALGPKLPCGRFALSCPCGNYCHNIPPGYDAWLARWNGVVPSVRRIGCECFFSCGDDPQSECSNSGTWHQHSSEPCPVHPDAPMS